MGSPTDRPLNTVTVACACLCCQARGDSCRRTGAGSCTLVAGFIACCTRSKRFPREQPAGKRPLPPASSARSTPLAATRPERLPPRRRAQSVGAAHPADPSCPPLVPNQRSAFPFADSWTLTTVHFFDRRGKTPCRSARAKTRSFSLHPRCRLVASSWQMERHAHPEKSVLPGSWGLEPDCFEFRAFAGSHAHSGFAVEDAPLVWPRVIPPGAAVGVASGEGGRAWNPARLRPPRPTRRKCHRGQSGCWGPSLRDPNFPEEPKNLLPVPLAALDQFRQEGAPQPQPDSWSFSATKSLPAGGGTGAKVTGQTATARGVEQAARLGGAAARMAARCENLRRTRRGWEIALQRWDGAKTLQGLAARLEPHRLGNALATIRFQIPLSPLRAFAPRRLCVELRLNTYGLGPRSRACAASRVTPVG